MSLSPTYPVEHAEFYIDAVLFDMDGTLVDSIAAVEAAWGSVAQELGMSAEEVIAATHGKRAIDNLKDLKPHLRRLTNEQMEPHVEAFEKSILREADEFNSRVASRRSSEASSRNSSRAPSRRGSSAASRRPSSTSGPNPLLGGSLSQLKGMSKISTPGQESPVENGDTNLDGVSAKLANLSTEPDKMSRTEQLDNPFDDDSDDEESGNEFDLTEYTEEEIGCVDKSVRILPGVRRFIDSLPKGRFAVATSGAKTYCHGALARAGIKRPPVTITADDKRLKRGKPFPDPFLLAAEQLGFPIEKCLVFEDSPSGIVAGVASGAKTIAVCTSHPVEKINGSGAHYIVPSFDCVYAFPQKDGRIKITIDAHPVDHPKHGSRGSFVIPAHAAEAQRKDLGAVPSPPSEVQVSA